MSKSITGIILAAGRGTRLQPLTDTTPKPLLPLAGKPLLFHTLEKLVPLVDRLVLVIGYRGEEIRTVVGDSYAGKPVIYAYQKNIVGGTMDAFRTGVYFTESGEMSGCDFILGYSDDIYDASAFEELQTAITQDRETAYVLGRRLQDHSRLNRFGVFVLGPHNEMEKVVEKPQEFISEVINLGVYFFPEQVKEFLGREPIHQGKEEWLTDHLCNPYAAQYPFRVIVTESRWLPVNSVQEYEEAKRALGDSAS